MHHLAHNILLALIIALIFTYNCSNTYVDISYTEFHPNRSRNTFFYIANRHFHIANVHHLAHNILLALIMALIFTYNCSNTYVEISYTEFHPNQSRNTEHTVRNSSAPLSKIGSSLRRLSLHSRLLSTAFCKEFLYQIA